MPFFLPPTCPIPRCFSGPECADVAHLGPENALVWVPSCSAERYRTPVKVLRAMTIRWIWLVPS